MMTDFWRELVRRGVLRALGAYVAIVWLLAQGLVDLLPAIGLPDWAIRVFLAFTVSATPLVGLVAWRYDLTTKGFLRDKRDVALRRNRPDGQPFGQTTRATPRRGVGRSVVFASWTNDQGDPSEQEFGNRFLIGRDFKADIRLCDDRVSRQHIEVYPVGDEWNVRDLSSLNGSYVDGQAIDVRKIDRDVEVTLDKDGPKVRLAVREMVDTRFSAESVNRSQAGR